jgi:hypothetical protein
MRYQADDPKGTIGSPVSDGKTAPRSAIPLDANNRSSKAALDPCHTLESEFTDLGLRMGLAIGARNQSLM